MKSFKAVVRMAQSAAASAAFLGLLMTPAAAAAEGSETRLSVTATILKHASMKVLAQPSSLVVTAADVARGYVEVPSPTQIAVRSNSAGYMLVFVGRGEFVRQIRVRGLGSEVQMGADGGVISQANTGRSMSSTTLDLGFRFELSASAQQGSYSWPIQMSIIPL